MSFLCILLTKKNQKFKKKNYKKRIVGNKLNKNRKENKIKRKKRIK